MKPRIPFPILASILGLALAPAVSRGQRLLLIDANFNRPTEITSTFPPSPGEEWIRIQHGVEGWAKGGGQIAMTHGAAHGRDNSGGVRVLVKKAFLETMTVAFKNIDFPMLNAGYSISRQIRSIKFSIDAAIPVGRQVTVQIIVSTPKAWDKEDPLVGWRNVLVLGTLTGDGDYRRYTCDMEALPAETISKFITYIRNVDLNGVAEIKGDVELYLSPTFWKEGEQFQFDNVLLSIESQ